MGEWTLGPRAAVAGTVVSVDATAGTFVADAYVLTPPTFTGYPGPGVGGPRVWTRQPGWSGMGPVGEA